ncbi:hypothetical protein [Streptomyces sp. 1222.5]|uniref:hypothetical protein n=1 Tax=Streptomyces sp. 1222.5 TaxID=1881026 RepID=UPI003D74B204
MVQAATGDGSGKAAPVSLLPVTSSVEHPWAQGSGGYTVPASESDRRSASTPTGPEA